MDIRFAYCASLQHRLLRIRGGNAIVCRGSIGTASELENVLQTPNVEMTLRSELDAAMFTGRCLFDLHLRRWIPGGPMRDDFSWEAMAFTEAAI